MLLHNLLSRTSRSEGLHLHMSQASFAACWGWKSMRILSPGTILVPGYWKYYEETRFHFISGPQIAPCNIKKAVEEIDRTPKYGAIWF